ncbi:hypothetical protein RCH14_003152 [Massilia sp. MP_M2]
MPDTGSTNLGNRIRQPVIHDQFDAYCRGGGMSTMTELAIFSFSNPVTDVDEVRVSCRAARRFRWLIMLRMSRRAGHL